MQIQPLVKVREVDKEEKEITSNDLTKIQLMLYILNDFLKGLYVIGCLFLNGLIILQLYSFLPERDLTVGPMSNLWIRVVTFSFITVVLEIFTIYSEIKIYRRIWPKGSLFIGSGNIDLKKES